jgi:hypothetical protein
MGPTTRTILAASVLSLGLVLGGCADFDVDKIGDKIDVFGLTKKKPLPGERKDVFPEGVPGVSQGVPPELTKGYQAPADVSDPAEVAAAKAAQEEASAKPKPKPKPKQTAKATPPKPRAQQQQQQQTSQPQQPPASGQASWPSQQPQQPAGQQAQAPWPSQPSQPQQSTTPWPGSR